MAALAFGLFIFIILYERREGDDSRTSTLGAKLLSSYNPASITSVETILRSNQIVRVERANDEWSLTLPFEYPAHSTKIEHLLNAFGQLNQSAHISPQELLTQTNLSDFGLDPARATIIVKSPHSSYELKIGGKTPVGNQVYVQLVGADGIFFTDASLLERLPNSVDDWRDPMFLFLKNVQYNRVEVRTGTGGFEILIDPTSQQWRLNKPLVARADNRKIASLLHLLQSWQVTEFITQTPKPDLEQLGLQPPETVIAFGQGSNDVMVVPFGKSPTNNPSLVYALCPPKMQLVKVPRELLDKFRVPLVEWRDPRLVSNGMSDVGLIEVTAGERFVVQKQTDGKWKVVDPAIFAADPVLMKQFLDQLNAMEVAEYVRDVVTDFSKYGLNPPMRRYTLKTGLTNTVAGVTNRIEAQIDFGTNRDDKVYARLASEDFLYSVPIESVVRLPAYGFQLRDRRIWNFNSSNVTSVAISFKGQNVKLVRNAASQWTIRSNSVVQEMSYPYAMALEATLQRLGELKAINWYAQGEDKLASFGFPDMAHSLSFEVTPGSKPISLSLDFGYMIPPQKVVLASTVIDGHRLIFDIGDSFYQLYFEVLRALPLKLSESKK